MASRYLPSEKMVQAGGDGQDVSSSFQLNSSDRNSGIVVPGLDGDDDLTDTLLIASGDSGRCSDTEDVNIVTTSATTPPIAIRGRS